MRENPNRRTFVRALAVGATAAPLVATGALLADDEKSKTKPKTAEEPAERSKDVAKKEVVVKKVETKQKAAEHDAAFEAEVDARMQLVAARCGSKLDEASKKSVREELVEIVERSRTLKKFALDNGDGPYPVFHPYRGPAGA